MKVQITGLLIVSILGVVSARGFLGYAGFYGHNWDDVESAGLSSKIVTIRFKVSGVITFDNHACVIQNGKITITGPLLKFKGSPQNEAFEVSTGFGIIETGERVLINNGLINLSTLLLSDIQAIRRVLAQAGMTYNQFIKQTGTISPDQGIFEVTAGLITINGVYKNINAGLMIVVGWTLVDASEPGTPVISPVTGNTGHPGTSPVTGNTGNIQTIVVTETAAHETETVSQTVTLTKTTTRDVYTTITSPVYNSVNVDSTNFIKQTITVQEEQVIRSSLPGNVIVNTIPVETQVILTVTNTATQFLVNTVLDTITQTLNHLAPNFNFRTVTINNPQTSTVIQVISKTSVVTAFITQTLDRTLYETSTVIITVAGATEPAGYY